MPLYYYADPEFVISDGQYWLANLRHNDQTLLGTTFITLKRHASELDQLTEAEEQELIVVRNGLIKAIRASFRPITFNFSCLKNDAFKVNPDDTSSEAAHVHWHLKPRYGTNQIEFGGTAFRDPTPGGYLSDYKRYRADRNTAIKIAQTIRNNSEFNDLLTPSVLKRFIRMTLRSPFCFDQVHKSGRNLQVYNLFSSNLCLAQAFIIVCIS